MSGPSLVESRNVKASRLHSSSSSSKINDGEKGLPRIILKNKTALINIPRASRDFADTSPRSIDLQSTVNYEVNFCYSSCRRFHVIICNIS